MRCTSMKYVDKLNIHDLFVSFEDGFHVKPAECCTSQAGRSWRITSGQVMVAFLRICRRPIVQEAVSSNYRDIASLCSLQREPGFFVPEEGLCVKDALLST